MEIDRTKELARVIELAENESRSPSHLAKAILASPVIAEIEREVEARVVEWLRETPYGDCVEADGFANAIEAGDHRSGA